MSSFKLLMFANLFFVLKAFIISSANNMQTQYQGPSVPIQTYVKLYSTALPVLQFGMQSGQASQNGDIYFLFQFVGTHSRLFRPIHPSNSSLNIYVNSIKANIFQEFDNQIDLYYFILQVKNYASKYSGYCEIFFEGAQANSYNINATTRFSQNLSTIQSEIDGQSVNYTISFIQNAYMLGGVPVRCKMQSYDGNRQPPTTPNIYKDSQLQISLYYKLTNLDLSKYSLFFTINYSTFDRRGNTVPFSQYISDNGQSISDGTWNFFIKVSSGFQYQISKLYDAIGIYNSYDLILQIPGFFDFSTSTTYFGLRMDLCKINNGNDCLFKDGDFIYAPEPFFAPKKQVNLPIIVSFPQNIEVLSDFEFKVTLGTINYYENIFILGINFPQDLVDFNQDLQFKGRIITDNQNTAYNFILIDINHYPLSSDYTVQILLSLTQTVSLSLKQATLSFKLRAPNRIFNSDNIKIFFQSLTPDFMRYKIQEVNTFQKMNFIQSKSMSLQITPLLSGIRVKTQYIFNIDLGQVVYQNSYVTIQIPKEITVMNMPNIQLTNFDPGQSQFCAPFLSIQNQLITISQMVCQQQQLAYTFGNPLKVQLIFSEFQNPQISSALDFYLNVFTIDQQKQLLYNDNSYYQIVNSKTTYIYEFVTNATAVCLNDIQLRGIICEQLLVTLNSNSGIFSTEEIVLTLPLEIIPPLDFIDNQGIPYQNKISCKLIESYLPTSICTIDIPSHTITITDSQFTNTIYQNIKNIIIYNTVIPRYMKPLGTNIPPFPSDVTPFSYIVRDSLTKVNSSTKQIKELNNFYKLPPINVFPNLQLRQTTSSLNCESNSIYISFSLQVQLHNNDLLQIFFPAFYNFAQSTIDVVGLDQSFTYQFIPHQSLSQVIILQLTITKTISYLTSTQIYLLVKNIQNPAQIPNYASATVINNYNVLSDSTIQIIDSLSQQPFQYQVVKNCFIITDSGQMTVQSVNIISRGVVSETAIYGEDMQLVVTISFSSLNQQDLQNYLDLYLNIPAISQDSLSQLQILINGQPTKDILLLSNPNYINSFRFLNFPFILSDQMQYYTITFQNLKSKKELFSNQASVVKVQRNLQVTDTYIAQLDSFTLNSQQSLVCDPSCLECVNVSTYCTACTPDKQLDTLIPGKCVAIIASKLMNVYLLSQQQDSLLNYNTIQTSQLIVSSFVDIYIQMQIFFTGDQSYFFEIQIPKIFSISSNSQLSYGQDSSILGSNLEILDEKIYSFSVEQNNNNSYISIQVTQPIQLIHSRYQIIKLTQVQLPTQNYENYLFTLSLLLKDVSNPLLVRQLDNIQKNFNIECNQYCKTCQGSPDACMSCYEGDIYDSLGLFCINQPCWNGQVKVKTSKGYVCSDNDHSQSCGIEYCLYCDTSPNNPKSKCLKCYYNFTLSEQQDKCSFKDPNINDKVSISNPKVPFDGVTQSPNEQINSTQVISREMDLRNLWIYPEEPLIPPNIKLYAPFGVVVCIFNIVYSLFNSLTQHKVSFTVETCKYFGFIDPFMSVYYFIRLVNIEQFYLIQIIYGALIVLKMRANIYAGQAILKIFNQELKQIGLTKEFIIRFLSYRYFFKIIQEQTRVKELKIRKIIQTRESQNQTNQQNDTEYFEIEDDDILDSNNPVSKQLDKIMKYIIFSILSSFTCVSCYVYSKIVYSELYSVSSQISTLMFEQLVYYFVIMVFDIFMLLKCMTTIGMYQNLYEPYQYNFKSGKQLKNDDIFQQNISDDKDKQTSNSQTNECQESLSYKLESPEQSKNTQKKQVPNLKKRHSWPQQNIEQSETFQTAIRSLFEKGQKRQIRIPLKGKQVKQLQDSIQQFDEKSYDHQGISQFNIAYLKIS
ncbi:transmembrane protein, putative (macronuclear) [Tetrahymena thermophila SB210]|uniref:Transmembrane protein, putative n=1 Tax=Tetrahymena thermophila (strain SB210) TaxID=312017 RepID=Q231C3_TETTS|nr:transmembrane protein, putative [Tetrahymena thermophila SB210]EAR91116.2 transmembrane protein, putative [Tetrahymena thermophila SB210]|eukprot:XP_001011361.2 transmembrane protein, putative [Tetrahymena thermophila SB210]